MRRKLAANATVSVIADEMGMRVRSKRMLRMIDCRRSIALMALMIAIVTS
jgi:hypothetical protein